MKRLLAVIVLAIAAWSGWWFIAATGLRSGFEAWFEARRAEDWVADYAELELRGYPNRVDTTFTDLALADPETGLAWEAPFFQILALSYKPTHVIAVWPHEFLVATPMTKWRVATSDMKASLVVEPGAALALERSNLVVHDLRIAPQEGQASSADLLRLAAERRDQAAGDAARSRYHLGLHGEAVRPSLPFRVRVDPGNLLPETLRVLRADLSVEFDRPWDRRAVEVSRPQPRRVELHLAEAEWGELRLAATGAVDIDTEGRPEGRLTFRARNWREIVDLARASGQFSPRLLDTVETGLELLAQFSGNPRTLDIPLDFTRGRMKLGPVPLGPAPAFRLR